MYVPRNRREGQKRGRRSKYNNELVGKQSRINYTSYFGFILHYFNYQYAGWLRRTYFTAERTGESVASSFYLVRSPLISRGKCATKPKFTRSNLTLSQGITYSAGKFFKITEKEVTDFYFNKGGLSSPDSKMFVFLYLYWDTLYV